MSGYSHNRAQLDEICLLVETLQTRENGVRSSKNHSSLRPVRPTRRSNGVQGSTIHSRRSAKLGGNPFGLPLHPLLSLCILVVGGGGVLSSGGDGGQGRA